MFGVDCFDWKRQAAPSLFAMPDLDCFAASVILSACCCDCSTGALEVRLRHPFGHPIDFLCGLCAASVSSLQFIAFPPVAICAQMHYLSQFDVLAFAVAIQCAVNVQSMCS